MDSANDPGEQAQASKNAVASAIDPWQSALLNLADMIGPVAHELHNVFNNMVLQAAIVARTAPEPLREQVSAFRGLAFRASQMLSQLDKYRYSAQYPRQPICLADVVREVVESRRQRGSAIHSEFEGSPLLVSGNQLDIRRLTELLIRAAEAAGPPVNVRVTREAGKVMLSVQDCGAAVDSEQLHLLFEPFAATRPGENSLERAACQTIARRLDAKLRASPRPGNGVSVTVEFKLASEGPERASTS